MISGQCRVDVFCHSAAYGNVVGRINEVNQRRAQLVLGWVTVCRRVNHLGMWLGTQVNSAWRNEYQRKLGHKQPHRAMH